nr:papain-like cysteine protease family protein [Tissierella sp.]
MSLLIVIIPVGRTYAETYTMYVAKYAQEKTNWCWSACAKMIGVYYGRTYSQSSICNHVKGSLINDTANLSEVTSAIRYASNKGVQAGVASFAAFLIETKSKRPAVLRIGWNSGGGHVYVVYGAKEGSVSTTGGLYLTDPIAGRGNAFYPYSKLVNGTTLASGTGKYTHTWWTYR